MSAPIARRSDPSANALYVATHPEEFHNQPAVLAIAWAQLMADRGNTVDMDRLGEPAHLISTPRDNSLSRDLADRAPRIRDRVKAHASRFADSGPYDGDAA